MRRRSCFFLFGLSVLCWAVSLPALALPRGGGSLVLGTLEEVRNLNPLLIGSRLEEEVASCLFSCLYRTDDDGNYLPDLLVKMPTKKGLTYQYELRKDVRFSDGHELTAEDVKFTWECWVAPDLSISRRPGGEKVAAFEIPYVTYKGKDGKTYKTPDKYRFNVTLKEADPSYEAFWADLPILPAHLLEKEIKANGGKPVKEDGFSRHPVGSGPFKLADWKPGSYLMVVKNPLYFRSGRPYLEEMIWRFLPDANTALEGLRKGEIDLFPDVPPEMAAKAAAIPWVALYKRPTSACSQIVFNLWDPKDLTRPHPILADLRVRRALALAFPRERIVEEALGNTAYPAYTDLPPYFPGYRRDLGPTGFDPEAAARLLEAAGWLLGPDGYRYKDGKKLRLYLFTVAGNDARIKTAALCREAWRRIGVELFPSFLDLAAFSRDCLARRAFDLAMLARETAREQGISSPWHSQQIPQEGRDGQNYGGYINREMDGLLEEMTRTEDAARRKELCRRRQELLAEEVPAVFISFFARLAAVREGLKNFRPNPHSGADLWNVEEWYWAW
ncbi:MAG: peptide ABC transporter substrate-binding protein [Bacillota bacterium]